MYVHTEPLPVFGRDFEQLQVFLFDGEQGVFPGRFASVFNFELTVLASAAHVSMVKLCKTPNDESVQRYLRESLHIISAAADISQTVEHAVFWFKNAPLQPFDDKTGHELASEGRTSDVLRYLNSLQAAFCG